MRQMVAFTLKGDGHDVLEGADGQDAMNKLNALGGKVDMVITDLNMPNMDGIAFIKALRAHPKYKFVPILMLTTESVDEKKKEGAAAGATGWIVKPFTPAQLLSVVKKLAP
jgi:two-component system chemotaxis response regulator CheY